MNFTWVNLAIANGATCIAGRIVWRYVCIRRGWDISVWYRYKKSKAATSQSTAIGNSAMLTHSTGQLRTSSLDLWSIYAETPTKLNAVSLVVYRIRPMSTDETCHPVLLPSFIQGLKVKHAIFFRVVQDFGSGPGSSKSGILPFFGNSAKSGSGQI